MKQDNKVSTAIAVVVGVAFAGCLVAIIVALTIKIIRWML